MGVAGWGRGRGVGVGVGSGLGLGLWLGSGLGLTWHVKANMMIDMAGKVLIDGDLVRG